MRYAPAQKHRIDADELSRAARGRWREILSVVAPVLIPAMERAGRHGPCPVHGGHDGLRMFKDFAETGGSVCNTCGKHAGGFATVMWVTGMNFVQTLEAVSEALGGARQATPVDALLEQRRLEAQRREEEKAARRADSAQRWVLRASQPLDLTRHAPVRRYFERRALDALDAAPADLHFAPALRYTEKLCGSVVTSSHPAMIAVVRSASGERLNVHRTYLTDDGRKADVACPKKLMTAPRRGMTMGGAIHLYPAGRTLAVTEGIETALAVRCATGHAVWACVTAGGLEAVEIPPQVEELLIYADNDSLGQGLASARKLEARMKDRGVKVRILMPRTADTDWADVWASKAARRAPIASPVHRSDRSHL